MRHVTVVIFFLAFLFAIPVAALAVPDDETVDPTAKLDANPYNIPTEWFACKTSDDCVKVPAGCGKVVAAVNKDHVRDAAELVKNDPQIVLSNLACAHIPIDYTVALCENSRCVLHSTKP